jgi:nucleotide-binding universal stress UspA family protein
LEYVIQVVVVLGVLSGGFIRSRRALEGLIASSVVESESASVVSPEQFHNYGESKMNKILIPVDGSINSEMAVKHAVRTYAQDANAHFYLCNVQLSLHKHISKFLSKKTINEWHAERAALAAASASSYLTAQGLKFSFNYVTGDKGTAIRDEAARLGVDRIVVGTSKKNSLSRLFENSTTARLLEICDIPVEVVTGKTLPVIERWGIPALGAGAATALMAVVID